MTMRFWNPNNGKDNRNSIYVMAKINSTHLEIKNLNLQVSHSAPGFHLWQVMSYLN